MTTTCAPAFAVSFVLALTGCTGGSFYDQCLARCPEQRACPLAGTTIVTCEQACQSQADRAERTGCVAEAEAAATCVEALPDRCMTADCTATGFAMIACQHENAARDPCLSWCQATEDTTCDWSGGAGCVLVCALSDSGTRALGCHAEWLAKIECRRGATDLCSDTECTAEDAALEACVDRFCAANPTFQQPFLVDCTTRS